MTLDDLNSNLNNCIQKLNEDLKSKLAKLTNKQYSRYLSKISKLIIRKFDKEFYNNLNKYFKQNLILVKMLWLENF